MFKLIASDMDGTLLDENGQVPPETYELILALREHGVHFAASSGRRYDRLCEFFAPVRDKMDFVAANGAQVYADGKMVDREVYSHLAIRKLAQAVATFPN
ncbi:MAG: HAD hydrolase family protein, partial [Collinsella sp.]|nr:HAD hydrolase family protein [Collinsella sp.]